MAKKKSQSASTQVVGDTNVLLHNNEQTHKAKLRFRNPKDLWDRFNDTLSKQKYNEKKQKKLIKMYERYHYEITKGGKVRKEPNWGRFTDAINEYVKFFASIALDRQVWCRIETYEGLEEQNQVPWSDSITEAFHKFCIKPWHKKEQEVISCISDDCFWNKGVMHWKSPFNVYPCHINSEDVFTDTNATTDPDSFDLLFIRDKMSAVDLYDRASDTELGWNSNAILKALASSSELSNLQSTESSNNLLARWRRGGSAVSQAEQDRLIPIVWCFVKEYKPYKGDDTQRSYNKTKEGNRISVMVIPENLIAMGVNTQDDTTIENSSQRLRRKDYLYFVDYYAKDFKEIISLWTSNIKRGFYSSSSFASQIYLGCRFWDQSMNSIIRAVKRSIRVWIKTGSNDTKTRMQQLDADDEVAYINQDDEISQIGIKQDVTAATELLRTVSASINQFSPNEFQGTQNSPKGYPITKGEAQILNQQLDDSKSMSIKLFISKNREFCCELYRRFVNCTEESDCWENYQRFVKVMNQLGIPKEAWDYKNVEVFPRFNQFAGKASANYAAAQGLLQATQIKAASVPEQRAVRNIIAVLSGEAEVSEYVATPIQFDSELFIIGQENEALDEMFASAANVPVTQSDNHFLHIKGHLQDYMAKLGIGNQLLNAAVQDTSYKKQFFIEYAANIVNAQDNKGAHIKAHFVVAEKDETKQDDIKELGDLFADAQAQQDKLVAKVKQLQDQESQNNSRKSQMDLEFEHDRRMKDQEYQFAKAMDQIKLEKAVNQTEIAQQKASENQAQKVNAKQQDQQLKVADKQIDIAAKTEQKRLDVESQRAKATQEQIKAEREARQPTNNEQ